MRGAKVFSTIDLTYEYHQISMQSLIASKRYFERITRSTSGWMHQWACQACQTRVQDRFECSYRSLILKTLLSSTWMKFVFIAGLWKDI